MNKSLEFLRDVIAKDPDYEKLMQSIDGGALPAVCTGNPFLYIIAKKDEDSMSVGLWNFFADEIISPEILLDREYSLADIYRNTGHIEGRKLILDSDIPPYGFVFFTVN